MPNRTWISGFIVLICTGLFVDEFLRPWGQVLVDVVVCSVFALYMYQSDDRRRLFVCLALATLGEVFLCHFLNLYTYREGNIPLFVPPGHVLLYLCGLWFAPRAPRWLWPSVLMGGVLYSLWCFVSGADQLSVVLFALWCMISCLRPLRSLVSVMVVLALVMEILGTSLGNWVWSPTAMFGGATLNQANPPFAAGVFYCGLDFLVNLLTRRVNSARAEMVEPSEI